MTLENTKLENNKHYPHSILCIITRDGRPAPRGGGVFSTPPRKNDQNRGEVAMQNKGLILNFFQ